MNGSAARPIASAIIAVGGLSAIVLLGIFADSNVFAASLIWIVIGVVVSILGINAMG